MKLFNEKGDLSDIGKDTFEMSLDKEIQVLLNSAENENELRIIGGLINKRVGDMVSHAIVKKKEDRSKFAAMTDQEFEAYLDDKYVPIHGKNWMILSSVCLPPEERERLQIVFDKKLNKIEYFPLDDTQKCTGYWWHDEYGYESFIHDDFTYCPVCDHKTK